MTTFEVGQHVRCKIDMESDGHNEGMGIQIYAKKGEELIVRALSGEYVHVSHEDVLDRTFSVRPDEIESLDNIRVRAALAVGYGPAISEVKHFDSVDECAAHFGMQRKRLVWCLNMAVSVNGWAFTIEPK